MKRAPVFLSIITSVVPVAAFAQLAAPATADGGDAQAPRAAATDSTNAATLQEVVITAQHRTQNILDVPISVSVIGGPQIEDSGIKGAADYALMTPNVFFTSEDAQSRNNGDVTIRGDSDLTAGTDNRGILSKPVIGMYLDGVAVNDLAGGSANPPLGDVERIEILRGPQSLYFGRAAEAGAVNIVMKKPTDENTATFQAGVGNYGYNDIGAILNHALTDDLYFRGSFEWSKDDGYVTNLAPGGSQANFDSLSGRAAFRWKPGSWVIDFVSQIAQTSGGAFGGLPTGVQPWSAAIYANGGEFNDLSTCGLGKSILINSDGTGNNHYFCDGNPDYTDTSDLISHITAKYSGDGYSFTSITSDINSTYHQLNGLDNSNARIFIRKNRYDSSTWAQEFRLASTDTRYHIGAVPFDWSLDVYGYDNAKHLRDDILTGPGTVARLAFLALPGDEPNANSIVTRWHGLSGFFDTTWHFTRVIAVDAGARYSMDQEKQLWTDTTSSFLCGPRQLVNGVAPPLQADCLLTDPGVIPGAIYTDASGAQWTSGGTAIQNLWTEGASRHYNFSPRVSLNVKPTPDQSFYLTYGTGYNPGGVLVNAALTTLAQEQGTAPAPDSRTFYKTETTTNLELGWHGYFDEHRMLASADVFREDQRNKQFINSYSLCTTASGSLVNSALPQSNVPGGPNSCVAPAGQPYGAFIPELAVQNAKLARSQGVEASLSARLGDHFDLQLAGAFLDAKFVDFNDAPLGVGPQNGPVTSSMDGIELPNSPRWSGSALFNAHTNIGMTQWFGTIGASYKDIAVTNFGAAYNPQNPHQWPFWTHAVTLVNLDTGVDFLNNRVTLSVQNLLNTFYENGPGGGLSVTGATVQLHPRVIQLNWRHMFSEK